jgi:hypothetical protein
VSALTSGSTVEEGQFEPNDAAYEALTPTGFSAQGKLAIVPNDLSGPSVIESPYELDFSTATNPYYTAHTFHSVLNQPMILNTGECSRLELLLNKTFSDPVLRSGKVTLYSPPLPAGFQGLYQGAGVGGYSAQGESIGFNPEACATASRFSSTFYYVSTSLIMRLFVNAYFYPCLSLIIIHSLVLMSHFSLLKPDSL